MNLKKIGKVFTCKFVGTGSSSYKKRIYRAAVSQRLRNTGHWNRHLVTLRHKKIQFRIHRVKVIPQQAEVAQGVPGRLRPRIFLTFGTTRVVRRQLYAPAVFTHFQRLSRPQGLWFRRREPGKNPQ
jgi:hypothetical protein